MKSKRISLTIRERFIIAKALKAKKDEMSMNYEVIQAGRQVYDDIISKIVGRDEEPVREKLENGSN